MSVHLPRPFSETIITESPWLAFCIAITSSPSTRFIPITPIVVRPVVLTSVSWKRIPIIDHYYSSSTLKEEFPGRSHFDYCVNAIVKWLDQAAEDLPATVDIQNLGRATSTICKALKARILLYAASPLWNGSFPFPEWVNTNYETPGYGKELVSRAYDETKWIRATKACEEALSYALEDGRREMFSLEASETLRNSQGIGLPAIPETDESFKKKVMQMRYLLASDETEGNSEVIWGVLTDFNNTNTIQSLPHVVVTLNNGMTNGGASGRSPYLYTVEHFYTINGLLPKDDVELPENDWFCSSGYSGFEDIIVLNTKREPRFYAWLSFDGDEYSQKVDNGQPLFMKMRDSKKQGYNPILFNRDNSVTGYSTKKFCAPDYVMRKDGGHNYRAVPTPFIRLAELYLNLAECYAETERTSDALNALNVVRSRAGIPSLTIADTNLMPLKEWVRNERFVELYAEGHRYYDVRRWMIAPDVLKYGAREGLNAIKKTDPTFEEFNRRTVVDQPFQWDDRMYLLPININEIYSNPQLIQSPKY